MSRDIIEKTIATCLAEYEEFIGWWIAGSCAEDGSPIEKAMRIGFWHYACLFPEELSTGAGEWQDCRFVDMAEDGAPARLFQQAKVGPYSLDFAIVLRASMGEHRLDRLFAVECDGFHFHDRTKQQVERDKGRDRYLAGEGFTVLRFAGSEIYRDAVACARQAMETVRRVHSDWNSAMGDIAWAEYQKKQEKQ